MRALSGAGSPPKGVEGPRGKDGEDQFPRVLLVLGQIIKSRGMENLQFPKGFADGWVGG